jgi:SdrD B-like protein
LIPAAPGSIAGFIFYDLNKDMVQDNNEQPFATVTVNLMDTSGTVIATAVTDANGNFVFSGVAPGDYLVQPVPPVNFFQTLPPGNAPIAVHVDSGQNVTGLIFALSC